MQTIAWLQIVLLTLISWQERPLCQQTESCWICAVIQVEEACQSLKEIVTLSKLLMHADVQQVAFRAQKAKLVHMISVALCRDACSLHNMLTVVP